MEYKFLKYLEDSDLKELENILLGTTSKEELLKQIQSIKNKTIDLSGYDFSSSYIPNYYKELEDKCIEVLKQLKTNDLFFFLASFRNKGNTNDNHLQTDYYKKLEDKSTIEDFHILKYLVDRVYSYYSRSNLETNLYLDKVNNMFENSVFQENYEGPYNMLNYIKNYIYFLLKQDKQITEKDVFLDYQEKKQLVTVQLKDISSYLYEIRNGTNLRICISNAGLKRTANKIGEGLTIEQSLYVDALAFGTTLEKIENKDYEDYKKLLYLPKGKIIK